MLKYAIPLLVLLFSGAGCDHRANIDRASSRVLEAAEKMRSESASWQEYASELQEDLKSFAQTTLRNDVDAVIQRGIASSGTEYRCSVDFTGKRVGDALERLVKRLKGEDIPPPEPGLCKVVPSSIDMSLVPQRRQIISFYGYDFFDSSSSNASRMLRLMVVDHEGKESDVSKHLNYLNHYEVVVNLTGSNPMTLTREHSRVRLYWQDTRLSEVAITWPPELREELVRLSPETYTPPHTHGDRDYKNHGPCFNVSVNLRPVGNELQTRIHAKIYECHPDRRLHHDNTTAEGTRGWKTVKAFGSEWEIVEILVPTADSLAEYHAHTTQVQFFSGGALVNSYKCWGDHGGDEAGTYSRVQINYDPFKVKLRRKN